MRAGPGVRRWLLILALIGPAFSCPALAQTDTSAKAHAFGLASETADGVDVFAVRDTTARLLNHIRSTSEPAVLTLTADRLCAHVGPVSTIAALDADAVLQASREADTRDPIVRCLGMITNDRPELKSQCAEILRATPLKIAAEFRRANTAFEARNAVAGLVAPPPPKSHTV